MPFYLGREPLVINCYFFVPRLNFFLLLASCPSQYLLISQAEVTSEQINTLLDATGNTEVEAFYPIIFAQFLSSPDKIAELIASPGGSGGGGGGAGGGGDAGGDAEEEEEEKPEEEEVGDAPVVDMFGAGDGGDY